MSDHAGAVTGAQPVTATPPVYEPSREVRLAVVLYGGVSLAIYMYGIARELLNLVKATAPFAPVVKQPQRARWPLKELPSTAQVYRKLAYLSARQDATLADVPAEPPVLTRFVIDVLSGASAGGINGVFLAKALANDQSLDGLRELWLREGDLGALFNDAGSRRGPSGVASSDPPTSLLNSQRMYRRLLDAFEGMESPVRSAERTDSPYVEELDLIVTATDFYGLVQPISLADGIVYGKRHRNMFRFIYATPEASGEARNDFYAARNPFLAFAARCTSSFPVAFEPMTLRDVDLILGVAPYQAKGFPASGDPAWERLFPDHVQRVGHQAGVVKSAAETYQDRPFIDGGVLDNKPFSYATESLTRHRASRRVRRYLLYVDPQPEHPEDEALPANRPDAVDTALQALSGLPRQESILEDIQRINDRNRILRHLSEAVAGTDRDLAAARSPEGEERPRPEDYEQDVAYWIKQRGQGYGVYHRLCIGQLTDDLAAMFARIAGFDEDSDEQQAIQYIILAWRNRRYTAYLDPEAVRAGKRSETRLLFRLDLRSRLRRITTLIEQIDRLEALDSDSEDLLAYNHVAWNPVAAEPDEQAAFRAELASIRGRFSEVYVLLRRFGRQLRQRKEQNPFFTDVAALGISGAELRGIMLVSRAAERVQAADVILDHQDRLERLDAIAARLEQVMEQPLVAAAHSCREVLRPEGGLSAPDASDVPIARSAARDVLRRSFDAFDYYDMAVLPLTYGTDATETEPVQIIRVSPEDARSLRDERADPTRLMLAGQTLGHFGAFVSQFWRKNDILWGRLDAAERLITVLLGPDPALARVEVRAGLIREAQLAIIHEEITPETRREICGLVAQALGGVDPRSVNEVTLRRLVEGIPGAPYNRKLEAVLLACARQGGEERILGYLRSDYRVDLNLAPADQVQLLARATTIIGRIMDGIANSRSLTKKPGAALVTVGRVLWGMVEVCLPGNFGTILRQHLIHLAYLLVGGLLLAATLFHVPGAMAVGLRLLACIAAVHVVTYLFGLYLVRRITNRHVLLALTVIVWALMIGLLAFLIVGFNHRGDLWPWGR